MSRSSPKGSCATLFPSGLSGRETPCARGGRSGGYLSMSTALLLLALAPSCGNVQLDATSESTADDAGAGSADATEEFDVLDPSLWRCEYSCPSVSEGVATFSLLPDVQPNQAGSWSKIRYTPRRFTSGSFTVRFALGERPTQSVWWGMALWDRGPSTDQSEYSEINFGYTTDGSFTNTQMDLFSARLGKTLSLKVDTGKDLYDGSFHTGTLVYDATRVELYVDGELLETITDPSVIPSDPLDLTIGSRLVSEPVLTSPFEHQVERCVIEW
jgi:hypothetical protein